MTATPKNGAKPDPKKRRGMRPVSACVFHIDQAEPIE